MLISCNVDNKKKIDINNPKFSTSDASELFFKNVRQSYYDREEMAEVKLMVYRLQERNAKADYPNIIPAIVINWRYDEAYLLLEPNEVLSQEAFNIRWESGSNDSSGVYSFTYGDKSAHFLFANQLYSSIELGHKLYLLSENEEMEFFNIKKDREAFRKTVKDYLRLVDLL